MEAFLPADEAPAAAGSRAGVTPAQIWLHSALGSNLIRCTVSMLACPKIALTSCLLRNALAAFKRPRFKKVGMRRAKKTKTDVTQTEEIINERIAAAKGGQVAKTVPPLLHTGVAAAPAPADKLQEQLEAAQFEVFRANAFNDLARKELVKAEKQHALDLKMYYARLERWAREARSKKICSSPLDKTSQTQSVSQPLGRYGGVVVRICGQ